MKKGILVMLGALLIGISSIVPRANAATVKLDNTEVDSITPTVIDTGKEEVKEYDIFFSGEDLLPSGFAGTLQTTQCYGTIIPIEILSTGQLYIDASAYILNDSSYIGVFYDAEGLAHASNLVPLSEIHRQNNLNLEIKKTGTYYIVAYSTIYSNNKGKDVQIKLKTKFYSNADRTLGNGIWTMASPKSKDDSTFYKINVEKAGYISIYCNSKPGPFNIYLCNKEKDILKEGEGRVEVDATLITPATFYVKKGTYYIKTNGYGSTITQDYYGIKYDFEEEITAKEGKEFSIYPANPYQIVSVKIKAPNTGYLTVTSTTDRRSGYIRLADSKKKAISNSTSFTYKDGNKVVYGVEKGKTYYLQYTTNYFGDITSKYTISKISDKSGNKKSNAALMKKNTTYKGVITAGNNTADFYKIVIKKSGKITINFKSNSTGKLKAQVFNSSGKVMATKTFDGLSNSHNFAKNSNIAAGTYYIKVWKADSKGSGWYSVNYK